MKTNTNDLSQRDEVTFTKQFVREAFRVPLGRAFHEYLRNLALDERELDFHSGLFVWKLGVVSKAPRRVVRNTFVKITSLGREIRHWRVFFGRLLFQLHVQLHVQTKHQIVPVRNTTRIQSLCSDFEIRLARASLTVAALHDGAPRRLVRKMIVQYLALLRQNAAWGYRGNLTRLDGYLLGMSGCNQFLGREALVNGTLFVESTARHRTDALRQDGCHNRARATLLRRERRSHASSRDFGFFDFHGRVMDGGRRGLWEDGKRRRCEGEE